MVRPNSIRCQHLAGIATVLLTLASWPAFAEENDPTQPTSTEAARAQTEAADPNATTKSDEAKPSPLAPNEAGAASGANGRLPVETLVREATPDERLSWLNQLFRYESKGNTRRLLDMTFPYSKEIAQWEVDFDKCLDQERYEDGEKVVANLVERLRASSLPVGSLPGGGGGFGTGARGSDHALLKAWEFETALCRRAADGEFGAGPNRRRSVALARLKRVREMAEALPPIKTGSDSGQRGVTPPGGAVAAVPLNNDTAAGATSPFGGTGVPGSVGDAPLPDPSALAYLLLRASLLEVRHSHNVLDEFTQAVNAVLDHVTVNLPVPRGNVEMGEQIAGDNVDGLLTGKRAKLRDIPLDALLFHDFRTVNLLRSFATTTLAEGMPVLRLQLGTDDDVTQSRIHSTLGELFPTETIEVHVVRNAGILRASLLDPVNEKRIIEVASHLVPTVLNQMTVSKNAVASNLDRKTEERLEPIGEDIQGIRDVFRKLYPNEHIEAHIVARGQTVVLRGHLSRPELARQVYDIAATHFGNVLYQMTPPLPPKQSQRAAPTTKRGASNFGVPGAGAGTSPEIKMSDWVIIKLAVADVEGAAAELQKQFEGRAQVRFGPRLDSISVMADPKVIEEVRTAAAKLDGQQPKLEKPAGLNPLATMLGADATTRSVSSIPPIDEQEVAMDREARQLAMKIRTAKPDEQPALRRQLEQLTERHFEQRQQRRKREIDELGHRLDKLRVTHHRREENKAAVTQRRVQDLLDPNADLRWEEPRTNENSNSDAAGGVSHVPAPKAATTNSPEPTFDGTPYSQWLKMLETERKPEKLASAMEACSRLVVSGDEQRIVRGIIAAARLFDATENVNDLNTVWVAGQVALRRLLIEGGVATSETVAEELLAHVSNPQMAEAPGFVSKFFVILSGNKPIKSLQTRAPAFVSALLRHHAATKEFDPRFAAAATAVWMHSGAPIQDFEGLRPLVLKGYDNDPAKTQRTRPWSDLATSQYVAEVPEIVTILGQQIDKNPGEVIAVLGNIGPAAEPAVPQLVAHFLRIWQLREQWIRDAAAAKSADELKALGQKQLEQLSQSGRRDFHRHRMDILKTLQKIGPGAQSAAPLLLELRSIAPAKENEIVARAAPQSESDQFFAEVNKTLLAIGITSDDDPAGRKPLLSEFSHLATTWKLASSRPGKSIPGVALHVGADFQFGPQEPGPMFQVLKLLGCRTSGPNFTLDETTTPKQITLLDRDEKTYQQFGIYEMSGDRLKIEFAKPGLPRPKEFSADRDQLPEGHVLLEFERDRGDVAP